MLDRKVPICNYDLPKVPSLEVFELLFCLRQMFEIFLLNVPKMRAIKRKL